MAGATWGLPNGLTHMTAEPEKDIAAPDAAARGGSGAGMAAPLRAPSARQASGAVVIAFLAGVLGGGAAGSLSPLLAPASPPAQQVPPVQTERLTALENAVAALTPRAAMQDLERRLAASESSLAKIRADADGALVRADSAGQQAAEAARASAALRAGLDAANGEIKALGRREPQPAAAAPPPAAAEAPPASPPVDLAPLETRIARLEGGVAEAARQASEQAEAMKTEARVAVEKSAAAPVPDTSAALAVVADVMQRRVEAGLAFPDELAAAERLGAPAETLALLRPFAERGLPRSASLADGLAAALRKPVAAPAASTPAALAPAGWIDRLAASSASLVRVTPPPGAAEAAFAPVAERLRQALTQGDDAAAQAELDRLPEAQRAATADLARALRDGAEARAAARALLAASLAALGKPRP